MKTGNIASPGGLAGWIVARWRDRSRTQPRLALLERITLGPRQTLSLVEAEGRRFLVASSPEGSPTFYPLNRRGPSGGSTHCGRVSW
jgi:hypothetical protein